MSRTYLIRIDGEMKNITDINTLRSIVETFVVKNQIWVCKFDGYCEKEFTIIFEAGACGGQRIKDLIEEDLCPVMKSDYIKEWELIVYDLHPDNIIHQFSGFNDAVHKSTRKLRICYKPSVKYPHGHTEVVDIKNDDAFHATEETEGKK